MANIFLICIYDAIDFSEDSPLVWVREMVTEGKAESATEFSPGNIKIFSEFMVRKFAKRWGLSIIQ